MIQEAPELWRQPPADLDRWRELRIERCGPEADEANERSRRRDLNRPQAEPGLIEVLLDPVGSQLELVSGTRTIHGTR